MKRGKNQMKKFLVGILFTMGLVLLSPSVSAESSISMYRMYNPNSGEHLYTRSVGERDNLKRYGWHYEGVAWQAPTSGSQFIACTTDITVNIFTPLMPEKEIRFRTQDGRTKVLRSIPITEQIEFL